MAAKQKIISLDLVPLFVRIALGIVFIYHGYGKVFEGGHSGIAKIMADNGVPLSAALGWLAGLTEFGGGCLILIGFLSRLWAAGLMVVMIVAIATVHGSNGFSIQNGGYEYCLTLLLLAFSILIAGAGGISADRVIFTGKGGKEGRLTLNPYR